MAGRSGREVADVLADAIEVSLDTLVLAADGPPPAPQASPAGWTDEQVLTDADAAMPDAEDRRLSELLAGQQAGWLAREEEAELAALMQMYQQGLLRRARGLRPVPLP